MEGIGAPQRESLTKVEASPRVAPARGGWQRIHVAQAFSLRTRTQEDRSQLQPSYVIPMQAAVIGAEGHALGRRVSLNVMPNPTLAGFDAYLAGSDGIGNDPHVNRV